MSRGHDTGTTAIVAFSQRRWDLVFQRPQQLLSRLARRHRVVYVEDSFPEACALPRLERLQPCENVTVLRPHLPMAGGGFSSTALRLLAPLLAAHLAEEAIDAPIAWLCSPLPIPLLPLISPRMVLYDCLEEPGPSSPRRMRVRHAQLLAEADLVLTGGSRLFEAKETLHESVHCIPNPFDAAHFVPERITANCSDYLAAERLQSHIPAPRLGFFGLIDDQVDLALVAALADARPDWQMVMVGPVAGGDTALKLRPNLHWLGHQPYSRLPAIVAAWDVCVLPYALNGHSRFVSPAKTLECLAAEKPVVSTAAVDAIGPWGDVVRVARGSAAFVDACAGALAETPEQRDLRLMRSAECVARFSWDETALAVQRLVDETLQRQARRRAVPTVLSPTVLSPILSHQPGEGVLAG